MAPAINMTSLNIKAIKAMEIKAIPKYKLFIACFLFSLTICYTPFSDSFMAPHYLSFTFSIF